MPDYFINKNHKANGDHEVHDATNGCFLYSYCREPLVKKRVKFTSMIY